MELATRLSETIADEVRVTLIDRNDAFLFGFSKLEVMFGRQSAEDVKLAYSDFAKDGVEFRQETVTGIDPATRRVTTDHGTYDAAFVAVALGADYDLAATPGFETGGHQYTRSPAPSGFATRSPSSKAGGCSCRSSGSRSSARRLRSRAPSCCTSTSRTRHPRVGTDVDDLPDDRPVPVTGSVSQMFRDGLAARASRSSPSTSSPPSTRPATAQLKSGGTLPYDLFIGIPVHRAPEVLSASGLVVNGWVPVDQTNLRTEFPGSTRSATCAPAQERYPRPGSSRRRRLVSSRTTSPRRSRRRTSSAVRRIRHLLCRVRRGTRQQGRSQLPAWRRPGRPA